MVATAPERLASAAGGWPERSQVKPSRVATRRAEAEEITIQLDGGRTVMITRETPDGLFQQGDRVQVITVPAVPRSLWPLN